VKPGGRILEYGCGAAPIVTSFIRSGALGYKYTIADIENFTFAFAKWKLLPQGVECITVVPRVPPALTGEFDTIFLMTVLEHLPDPLCVVQELTKHVRPGGNLILDYILGEGKGLDTSAGVDERSSVLEYLLNNYRVVHGILREDASMGITVLAKL
jgi:2-polyprenyl-3-methyl-5-hydroxy-6-metoxy-1,4-benzoquinol methylase